MHFPCCEVIQIELYVDFNFEDCVTHVDILTVEHERQFVGVETICP